jgi:flagellar biosynthesis regulator FlaF
MSETMYAALEVQTQRARDAEALLTASKQREEELSKKLAAAEKDRDCWIFNAKELQKGYNELDARLRQCDQDIKCAP